jgi:hypothetical protein
MMPLPLKSTKNLSKVVAVAFLFLWWFSNQTQGEFLRHFHLEYNWVIGLLAQSEEANSGKGEGGTRGSAKDCVVVHW